MAGGTSRPQRPKSSGQSFTRGDVVWADLDPAKGREQAKHRPYLVLSDTRYHHAFSLVIGVPMTSAERSWPTRVQVTSGSWAICEQVRTFSTERITRVERRRYDVSAVQKIVTRLIGGPGR
ncbi:type II toxin-antitoxin system PemK/MazF family toxin [Flexivirga alba]|uniref:Type II toxin-antitoxin system PemK/MazF family toxin n=1 Tax=Flexivirga alba TaxID=702742 RepID=A0ABW2AD85_9MICO